MKKLCLFIFFLFLFPFVNFSRAETITITTYYPAPYGVYEQLVVEGGLVGNSFVDAGLDPESPQTGLQLRNSSDTGGILLQDRSGSDVLPDNDNDTVIYWGNDSDDNLRFSNARFDGFKEVLSEKMRITADGKVAIGITNPEGLFHVGNPNAGNNWSYFSANVGSQNPNASFPGLAIGWNKSAGEGEANLVYKTSAGGSAPRLSIGSYNQTTGAYSEEMTIKNRNVGIGATDPQAKLHINYTTGNDPEFNEDIRLTGRFYGTSIGEFYKTATARSGTTILSDASMNFGLDKNIDNTGTRFAWFNNAQPTTDFATATPIMSLEESGNLNVTAKLTGPSSLFTTGQVSGTIGFSGGNWSVIGTVSDGSKCIVFLKEVRSEDLYDPNNKIGGAGCRISGNDIQAYLAGDGIGADGTVVCGYLCWY